ncbi:dynein assembly factor 3, axonemal homolog [Fopius arisanus]|uniref:Dynein assembly factor 3, axonemal homolog n=1 Tax=Fopius arisanus TaxID=64838 RepID=A0A9R1TCB0_9HYME|nr:PREDICTED: dynein assembly factor 3, axonemal homolog [Fopius arisanus]
MLWGGSPPLDLSCEIEKKHEEPLEILIIGACDARHIIKTLSSLGKSSRRVTFHVLEATLEDIARSILLINISLEKILGFQEASRYFLEVMGNTLVTPGTAKYLIKTVKRLIDVITQTYPCPWLNLQGMKYKDRDGIEGIFKFWVRALCEGVPIVDYWNKRVRSSLKTRYDYRDGVFDWDYHMVLKSSGLKYLTNQEYKFWRNNGVAFTWIETDPSRSNPTLLSGIHAVGQGFIHFAYKGDINNGPFFTWAIDDLNRNPKLRATDAAEGQVLKAIYQIRTKEECPNDFIAAHRDQSLIYATLVSQMPDSGSEFEPWEYKDYSKRIQEDCPWVNIPDHIVKFYPAWYIEKYKSKPDFNEKFDVAFVANNMTNQIPNIIPWVKVKGAVLVETRKFMTELSKEDHQKFSNDLEELTKASGLKSLESVDEPLENIQRYTKE